MLQRDPSKILSGLRDLVRLGEEERARQVAAALRQQSEGALHELVGVLEESAVANARRLQEVVRLHEQDRRLMLAELHDRLSAPLARLHLLAEELAGQGQPAAERVLRHSEAVMDALQRFLGEQRTVEETGDAVACLRAWIEDFSAEVGLQVACELPADLGPMTSVRSLFLVRIVQEALTNVARHARSREATVKVELTPGCLRGLVADAGPSSEAGGASRRGFGLRGMEERVRFLNGQFSFDSRPEGTTVRFEIPV